MGLVERDKKVIWHPYTQMKTALPHIPIVRGEGVYLFAETGKDAGFSGFCRGPGCCGAFIRVSDCAGTLF